MKRYIVTSNGCGPCQALAAEYADTDVETIDVSSVPYLSFVLQRLVGERLVFPITIVLSTGNGAGARALLGEPKSHGDGGTAVKVTGKRKGAPRVQVEKVLEAECHD